MMNARRFMGVWAVLIGIAFAPLYAHSFQAQANTSPPSAASDWAGIDKAQVRLVSSLSATNAQTDHLWGLEFKMEKGWKVYWRSPGDAGFPPSLTWQDNSLFTKVDMLWPRPERFEVLGLETLGYKDHVIYPLRVQLRDPAAALTTALTVRFLTCDDICIPVEVTLDFSLPNGQGTLTDFAQSLNDYASRVPVAGDQRNVQMIQALAYPLEDQKQADFQFDINAPWAWDRPDVFIEGPRELIFHTQALQTNADQTTLRVVAQADGLHYLETALTAHDFTLTVLDGDYALELRQPITLSATAFSPDSAFTPLVDTASDRPLITAETRWLMIAFAVLGGFILNFMPCVLPVLSIKIFGLIHHAHEPQAIARKRFLASSAGIMTSFWILAAGLLLLQSAGVAIGWGMQFQQPLFLVTLALITTAFACNLWGFFDIHLPRCFRDLGSAQTKGYGGDFLTGVFATLLATPCSAPFLGTALGFAFTQGPADLTLIFTALGFGLSFPYLLLALYPAAGRWFPKPGRWMLTLKGILGVFLLGTTAWLLSVLLAQVGMIATSLFAGLLVLLIMAFALKDRLRKSQIPALGLLVLTSYVSITLLGQKPDPNAAYAEAEQMWVPFDEAAIAAHVAAGRTVFVDVTAEWCITCKVNKQVVTYQGDVYKTLQQDAVIAMKADWTTPDPAITRFLAAHDRYAIPFNIIYGPNTPKGVILPEILNEKDVLSAFSQAKG